jgi:hypothetical protein
MAGDSEWKVRVGVKEGRNCTVGFEGPGGIIIVRRDDKASRIENGHIGCHDDSGLRIRLTV